MAELRSLVIVLGDQLDLEASALDGFDPRCDAVWMAEVAEESTHVVSSQQRSALFLSAMRHFAVALREAARSGDAELARAAERLIGMLGDSNEVWQRVIKLQQEVERDRENIRRFAAELAVTNSKLQQVALTDFLTGFPNRRYAMSRLQQEWASALRSGHDLACMVVDVDTFKQINDSYGHDVGDAVLRHLAVIFREAVRAEDVICRMGGDEFLVICPNSSLDAALSCAHRLRDAVTASQVVVGSLTLGISISIGVAERDPGMTDVEAMIKRADESVYLAKARGRNCVVALQAPG